jgi:hypothetical protein
MLNASLGTFFWLSCIYFYLKYSAALSDHIDFIFLMVVVIFMYFINVNIMNTKCSSSMSVYKATLLPWLAIFIPMIFALILFPEWKRPFSNTIGYIVARLAGGPAALIALLPPKEGSPYHYVYDDPAPLINQFTPTNFDEKLKEYGINSANTDSFRKIVLLKDIVSHWVWYLLTASVVISTSYNIMMNTECTKSVDDYVLAHNIAITDAKEKTPAKLYSVTE